MGPHGSKAYRRLYLGRKDKEEDWYAYNVKVGGESKACEVRELERAVRASCLFCTDFTARLADISVGSIGSPDGFSTVITRSKKGEELFGLLKGDGLETTSVDHEEIAKLVSLKRKRGREELEKLGGV